MPLTLITTLLALAVGALAGYLAGGRGRNRMTAEKQSLEAKLEAIVQSHAAETALLHKQADTQKTEAAQTLQAAKAEADRRMADYKEEVLKRHNTVVEEIRQNHDAFVAEQERRHREDTAALEKRFADTVAMLREQVENTTNTMLKQRQEEFAASSSQNIDSIVKPLKETIAKMKEEMARNSTVQTNMSAEIKTNMEHMIRQSIEAQKSAEELTRAFKHESKTQGNWGEVVLSNLLEKQGFTEGKDFEVQTTLKDADGRTIHSEEGNRMIPDVLLHLDEKRDIIIDSKVSMTAFIDYANAEDEAARRLHLKEHIASLKKHVDELSAKNYTQYQVNPHLDFVIMFVPQSPALWAATAEEPSLWQDAMQKKVFIADEQTLYAALRIIRITWTHIDQERNHQRLYELAQEMLNRTGTFLSEFDGIGRNLEQALGAFEAGKKKLLPGGKSIATTANQILSLGISNLKQTRTKRGVDTIIPQDYLSGTQPDSTEATGEAADGTAG
ncbi:MAG: DNA recombination protein RmuC [Bacteroidales bacterium]|nr:DNA recombination protein RmuC [Bacteroidales bacterium]